MELPNWLLRKLADIPAVESIVWDRPTSGDMNSALRSSVGARSVQDDLGYDGAGVGVAIIDSGVTNWHDDLTYQGTNPRSSVVNGQRVAKFVDFVNGRTTPTTTTATGRTSPASSPATATTRAARARASRRRAHLVSLKVLDDSGGGYISDVIAALDWAVAEQDGLQHPRHQPVGWRGGDRVVQHRPADARGQARRRRGHRRGGGGGQPGPERHGHPQYGAITAPGNAPWVLTVGAYSHQGTTTRIDDVMAPYSSHGPTAFDFNAKPDVVAPGTGIVSLRDQVEHDVC